MCKNLSLRNVAQYHQPNLILFLNFLYQNKQKSLEWTSERGLPLPSRLTTQGSLNVIQKEDIVNSQKFNYVPAVIEVVTDKKDFQWMKKQIDEINITLEMLEKKLCKCNIMKKKRLKTSAHQKMTRKHVSNLLIQRLY